MQINLPDQTVRNIQAMLAQRGDSLDVSAYVDRTLQRALFFDTVREIKKTNAGADPVELERLIDEAVSAVRQAGCEESADADGS